MLKDLQALQYDVVDQRTRPLVAEVVKAYEAGALRAATVSLWIAVVADLTYKIRHPADSGDGAAVVAIADLDQAVANRSVRKVQEYERTILTFVSTDLEMLSAREVVELGRLSDDRNLCAHPGFVSESELFEPDAEAVRAHLIAANRSVFSQPPLAGKKLLTILDQELYGDSWPDGENDELKSYLVDRFFRSARTTVQDNMTRMLIKGSVRPKDESHRNAKRCRNAAYAIADAYPASFERLVSSVLNNWERAGALANEDIVRSVATPHSGILFRQLPERAF